jgi:2'-5' RNA ligase
MRLFIAVKVPTSKVLDGTYHDLKQVKNINPARPKNHHLTLKFLGDPKCDIDGLTSILSDVKGEFGSSKMKIEGCGSFPNWKRPSVIWLGFTDPEPITALANMIDQLLNDKLGIDLERRPYKPHLTLCRIKGPVDVRSVRKIADRCAADLKDEDYTVDVDSFHLISSTLTPEGPVYETIDTFTLGG